MQRFIEREKEIKGRVVPYRDRYRDQWIGILASSRHIIIAAHG
jgi:hypothetical protein